MVGWGGCCLLTWQGVKLFLPATFLGLQAVPTPSSSSPAFSPGCSDPQDAITYEEYEELLHALEGPASQADSEGAKELSAVSVEAGSAGWVMVGSGVKGYLLCQPVWMHWCCIKAGG